MMIFDIDSMAGAILFTASVYYMIFCFIRGFIKGITEED
jgi:hypothetical protein